MLEVIIYITCLCIRVYSLCTVIQRLRKFRWIRVGFNERLRLYFSFKLLAIKCLQYDSFFEKTEKWHTWTNFRLNYEELKMLTTEIVHYAT